MKKNYSSDRTTLKSTTRAKWILYLPAVIFGGLFGWYPLILGLLVGFQKYHFIRPAEFVGFANYQRIFRSTLTPIVFRNTFYFSFLSIGLTFFVPIIIAILLMEMKKSIVRVMMILWFIPMASMGGLVIWKYFYNVKYGLFNGILRFLGLPPLGWLNDSSLAMLCLVLPGLIMFGPGLIYIASIQSVPDELYEASHLEGASIFQQIWHISLARLRPIIAMMMLLAIIKNMQVFEGPLVMTGGGPGLATTTVVMRFFNLAFINLDFGRGSALATLLFGLITIIIVIQRKYFKENIDK